MALDEKILQARRRRSIRLPRRSKACSQEHLAKIEQELDGLRALHPRIRRCMREQDTKNPWYRRMWGYATRLFFKEETAEQLYWRQQQGFSTIRAELGILCDATSEEKQRFEGLYEKVCAKKQESEERLSSILFDLEQSQGASLKEDTKRCGNGSQDKDALARRITDLEYHAENQKDLAGILERRRRYLHEICMQYIEIAHTYARLCQQAAAFEQESLHLREACGNFTAGNGAAESLFGSLDAFIAHIGDLRQTYQDSRQMSKTYYQELQDEAESAQRFQEQE